MANADKLLQTLVSKKRLKDLKVDTPIAIKPAKKRVTMKLLGGKKMTVTIDEITATRNNGALGGWADVEVLGSELSGGRLLSGVVLSFTPDTAKGVYDLSATIDSGAASVEIEQLAGASYTIDSRNEAKLRGKDDGSAVSSGAAPKALAPTVSKRSGIRYVSIVVGYTKKMGSAKSAKKKIRKAIAQMNSALKNSGIEGRKLRVKLVGTKQVDYKQNADMGKDLNSLKKGTGTLGAVKKLRKSKKADLATLMVPKATSVCGIAYVLQNKKGDPSVAYSVATPAAGCPYTFAHELGHSFGASHALQDGGNGLFADSHGHKVSNRARTLMAYACSDHSCPRVLQFSNPKVDMTGRGAAVKSGVKGKSNNARTVSYSAPKIDGYNGRLK